MESFVRSKYESRRWALDGPPPADPSFLDNGSAAPVQLTQQQQSQQAPPVPNASRPAHAPSNSTSTRTPITTRQPQAHQLLSSNYSNAPRQSSTATRGTAPAPVAQAPPQQQQPKAPENDLFSLDFHAPPVNSLPNNSAAQPKKDIKQDILSLFSSPPVTTAPAFGQFGGSQASPWGNVQSQQPQQQQQQHTQMQQPTSMIGNNGAGAWGANSGWTGTPAAVIPPAQSNLWGNPTSVAPGYQQQQANLFNTNDVWSSPASSTAPAQDLFSTPFSSVATKKDDAFGDIWGGFK
jgi:stromal membrane-associated protein